MVDISSRAIYYRIGIISCRIINGVFSPAIYFSFILDIEAFMMNMTRVSWRAKSIMRRLRLECRARFIIIGMAPLPASPHFNICLKSLFPHIIGVSCASAMARRIIACGGRYLLFQPGDRRIVAKLDGNGHSVASRAR